MSYHNDCGFVNSTVYCKVFDWLLNHTFTIWVQRWSGFIEDYNFWLAHESAGNRYSLFLPSTQIITFFTYFRVKFLREALRIAKKLHATCSLSCALHIFYRIVLKSVDNVFLDCTWEDSGILIDQTDLPPKSDCIDFRLFMISKVDTSWLDRIKFLNELDNGWLSRSTFSNKGYIFSRLNSEGEVFES